MAKWWEQSPADCAREWAGPQRDRAEKAAAAAPARQQHAAPQQVRQPQPLIAEEISRLRNEGATKLEIVAALGISYYSLRQHLPNGKAAGERHYRARPIQQLDHNGSIVREWPCMSAAAAELKISVSNICGAARGRHHAAGGYRWRYADARPRRRPQPQPLTPDQQATLAELLAANATTTAIMAALQITHPRLRRHLPDDYRRQPPQDLTPDQRTEINRLAAAGVTKRDIRNKLGISHSNIRRYLPDPRRKSAGPGHYRARPILQLDRDGNFVREWPTAAAAAAELGLSASRLCDAARGRQPAAGGYLWRYATPDDK